MDDIDLIPQSYRRARQQAKALQRLVLAAVAILATGASSAGGLAYAASRVRAGVDELQRARSLSDQQRAQVESLGAERARLEEQWTQLQRLRASTDVDGLLRLIDETLPAGELWFDRLELRLDPAPASTASQPVNAGYMLVVPAGDGAAAQPAAQASMRITGQALDHAALSSFVRGLYSGPAVRDVHLQRTTLRRYTRGSVVDFDLAVMLESGS